MKQSRKKSNQTEATMPLIPSPVRNRIHKLNTCLLNPQRTTSSKSVITNYSLELALFTTTPVLCQTSNQVTIPVTTPNAPSPPKIINKRTRFGQITGIPFNDTSWIDVFYDTSWTVALHDFSSTDVFHNTSWADMFHDTL